MSTTESEQAIAFGEDPAVVERGLAQQHALTGANAPEAWGDARAKTVEWWDPIANAKKGAELAGIDYLRAMMAGELPPPPISRLFGFSLVEVADGLAHFAGVPDESAYNPIGIVHGGTVCTLLDSAIGCAVQTQLPAGVGYTSIDLTVSYLRPVHATTGAISAIGTVTKPGRRVAFAEAKVVDSAGKLIATATGSCLIMGPA
ncbi:MAG: PaaI family thioesterase [Solirubrobacteraceae bacterium]|nr:PaaI family thioesterase [Patulibacter sp.]